MYPATTRNYVHAALHIPGAGYVLAGGIVIACTTLGYHLRPPFSTTDIVMLYLVGAVAAAATLGRGPSMLYSILSVSAFNYFFVDPIFSFHVHDRSYWLTFAVIFLACLVISTLAARLRDAEKEKMRNILLRSISHDLRSPLAAISGAADTLLQSGEMDQNLVTTIRIETARLSKVISNLLDITRIEGGHLKLNMRAYDPLEIIGAAANTCREALKEHKLTLNVARSLPFVRMDGLLMSQVIQNLLENAARHTPAGTAIELKAYVSRGGLTIAVSDNGPGIPPGQERNIFTKFSTCSQGDRPKGTGLGLAICQAILSAHRGNIFAENLAGGGCRFAVELPAELMLPLKDNPHE